MYISSSDVPTSWRSAAKEDKQLCIAKYTKNSDTMKQLTAVAMDVLQCGLLPLLDGNTSVNQCHVTALRIAESYNKIREGIALNEEDEHFVIFCLISCPIITKTKGLNFLFQKSWERTPIPLGTSKRKKIEQDRKKEANELIRTITKTQDKEAIKAALVDQIFFYISCSSKELEEVGHELEALTESDELCIKGQRLKTYPKYAGSLWYIEKQKNMATPPAIVVKVKYCCMKQSGSHEAVYFAENITAKLSRNITIKDWERTCMVVEGVSLPKGVKYDDYKAVRNRCYNQLIKKDEAKTHGLKEDCELCRPCPEEDKCLGSLEHLDHLEGLTLETILLKVGAAFNHTYQRTLEAPMKSCAPTIASRYVVSLNEARETGFTYEDPAAFVIEHIHLNTLKGSIGLSGRLVDKTPNDLLSALLNPSKRELVIREIRLITGLGITSLNIHQLIADYLGE